MRSHYDTKARTSWATPQARTTSWIDPDGTPRGGFRRYFNRYDTTTRQYTDKIKLTHPNPTSGAWWITDPDGAISIWHDGEWRIIGYQIGTEIPATKQS